MYILNDGIRMEICIVLFGSSTRKTVSVSVINARRSILKKAAKSSMRYAGRMASPCRILLSCEWSLLMPDASCRTLIQRSLRSCLTCLQTRSSKGVFCWCFITLFFAAKLLLLWHISVAYFSTFAPPCGEFLHTKLVCPIYVYCPEYIRVSSTSTPYTLHPPLKKHPKSDFFLLFSKKITIFAPVIRPCLGIMS